MIAQAAVNPMAIQTAGSTGKANEDRGDCVLRREELTRIMIKANQLKTIKAMMISREKKRAIKKMRTGRIETEITRPMTN